MRQHPRADWMLGLLLAAGGSAMTRPGRIAIWIVAGVGVVLQVVAYEMYHDDVDGQAILANVALAFYTLVAIAGIRLIDRAARAIIRRRRPKPQERVAP